jgi:hypothetical protein
MNQSEFTLGYAPIIAAELYSPEYTIYAPCDATSPTEHKTPEHDLSLYTATGVLIHYSVHYSSSPSIEI